MVSTPSPCANDFPVLPPPQPASARTASTAAPITRKRLGPMASGPGNLLGPGQQVARGFGVGGGDDPVLLVADRGDRGQRALPLARVVPQPPVLGGQSRHPDRHLVT